MSLNRLLIKPLILDFKLKNKIEISIYDIIDDLNEATKILNLCCDAFKISKEELNEIIGEKPENLVNKFSWVPTLVIQEAFEISCLIDKSTNGISLYLHCAFYKFKKDDQIRLLQIATKITIYCTRINIFTGLLLDNRNNKANNTDSETANNTIKNTHSETVNNTDSEMVNNTDSETANNTANNINSETTNISNNTKTGILSNWLFRLLICA